MAGAVAGTFLSWENMIYVADFLKAAGERHVSLLGGEPTLHPECVDFILYLLERDFEVTVFTNVILSHARLEEFRRHLTEVHPGRLNLVCNLNHPGQTPSTPKETKKILRFLAIMGPWVTLGFNIYRLDFALDFLFDVINRFGLKRHLRLGIAHPIPGQKTGFVRPEDMRQVAERLYAYRPYFDGLRISPGLDCGFPICQFTDEELGWLHRFKSPVIFGCQPALDISPDMSIYHCFPFSQYLRKSLFEFDSLRQVEEHFIQVKKQIKTEIPGIYPECDGCQAQEDGVCSGGGLCQILNRFIWEEPIRISEIEHELAKYRLSP